MRKYTETTSPLPDLVDAAQVAESLGCSKPLIYLLAQRGEIPSVRIGRTVRFDPADIRTFVAKRKVSGAEE